MALICTQVLIRAFWFKALLKDVTIAELIRFYVSNNHMNKDT